MKAMRAYPSQQHHLWKWAGKTQNDSSEISSDIEMDLKLNINKGV